MSIGGILAANSRGEGIAVSLHRDFVEAVEVGVAVDVVAVLVGAGIEVDEAAVAGLRGVVGVVDVVVVVGLVLDAVDCSSILIIPSLAFGDDMIGFVEAKAGFSVELSAIVSSKLVSRKNCQSCLRVALCNL